MAKTFVAIHDPVHGLIRRITRAVPLCLGLTPARQAAVVYDVEEQDLPNEYFSLAMLHSIGGMPVSAASHTNWKPPDEERLGIAEQVNFFDILRLDRRCSRDLRLRSSQQGAGMIACELLAFGCGMLRAENDDPADDAQKQIRTEHGRIQSASEQIYAHIRTLHEATAQGTTFISKESYYSTNLVYGDALGELEQLWERRAETDLLEAVARSLQGLRQTGYATAASNAPLNLPEVMRLHLKAQAIWNRPPSGGRALLRRLEFILNHLSVDSPQPEKTGTRQSSRPSPEKHSPTDRKSAWDDWSGFDGWLRPPDSDRS